MRREEEEEQNKLDRYMSYIHEHKEKKMMHEGI